MQHRNTIKKEWNKKKNMYFYSYVGTLQTYEHCHSLSKHSFVVRHYNKQ